MKNLIVTVNGVAYNVQVEETGAAAPVPLRLLLRPPWLRPHLLRLPLLPLPRRKNRLPAQTP